MNSSLESRSWWTYIHEDLQELLREAVTLVDKVETWSEKFHDYSFVVFPAAKAYEGYLKTLFHDLGFISEGEFFGKRFRVGKAMNPDLEPRFRENESVYDKLADFCQGRELPDAIWETWINARNLLFHWFPNEKNVITFDEAKVRVSRILDTMDLAFKECKIDRT